MTVTEVQHASVGAVAGQGAADLTCFMHNGVRYRRVSDMQERQSLIGSQVDQITWPDGYNQAVQQACMYTSGSGGASEL